MSASRALTQACPKVNPRGPMPRHAQSGRTPEPTSIPRNHSPATGHCRPFQPRRTRAECPHQQHGSKYHRRQSQYERSRLQVYRATAGRQPGGKKWSPDDNNALEWTGIRPRNPTQKKREIQRLELRNANTSTCSTCAKHRPKQGPPARYSAHAKGGPLPRAYTGVHRAAADRTAPSGASPATSTPCAHGRQPLRTTGNACGAGTRAYWRARARHGATRIEARSGRRAREYGARPRDTAERSRRTSTSALSSGVLRARQDRDAQR